MLKKYHHKEDVARAARAALMFHDSESAHIKKYLKRAFNQNRDEWIEDSSDSDYELIFQPKRQKVED